MWYVYEKHEGGTRTRYPQQFDSERAAQRYVEFKKGLPAFKETQFDIEEEDAAKSEAQAKEFDDA